MSSPPFVAIELKNTHHVLGVLSRDADSSGGSDLALLAPESLTVRAPQAFATAAVPPDPPIQLQVPASQLQAIVIKDSDPAQRRQVFSNPLDCIVADDGSCAPLGAGAVTPTIQLNAVGASVATFDLDITNNAGTDGVAFTVLIQEARPQPDQPPFRRITEGKVLVNTHSAVGVQITLAPGQNPAASPIPTGRPVFILVSVAGLALGLQYDPNP